MWIITAMFRWVQAAVPIHALFTQSGAALPVSVKPACLMPGPGGPQDEKPLTSIGGWQRAYRSLLPPGALALFDPVAFLATTLRHVHGIPVAAGTWQYVGSP